MAGLPHEAASEMRTPLLVRRSRDPAVALHTAALQRWPPAVHGLLISPHCLRAAGQRAGGGAVRSAAACN